MEEITINSVEERKTKTNVPFWSIIYNGNMKATVWDLEISNTLRNKIGQGPIGVEIKFVNGFANIRGVNTGNVEVTNPNGQTRKIEVNPSINSNNSLLSQKDVSIIAQCMTKCACYGRNDVTIGMALDMYHEACLSLEQNG